MRSEFLRVFKNPKVIALVIILLGVFLRTYKVAERFEWGHDADLFSWIVKDILVNHHIRLIGQLTSAPGIYIGGLFYYMLVPFYWAFNMNPLSALIPVSLLGIVTMILYFVIFSKLFNRTIGVFALFIDGILLYNVGVDRWVVPTVLTNLWTLLYFYSLIKIVRKDFSNLWLLGVLLGLIWHVHIALIPTLIAVPVAFILSKKIPNFRSILTFLVGVFVGSFPFFLFEYKHHFSQTFSIIENFTVDHGGGKGFSKLALNYIKISKTLVDYLFLPNGNIVDPKIFATLFLFSGLFLFKTKLISLKENILLVSWFIGPLVFFSISSTIVSEYYFSSYYILYLVIAVFWLSSLFNKNKVLQKIIIFAFVFIAIKNVFYFITIEPYQNNYLQKKDIVDFITQDSKEKGYPCVAVSYITQPGNNVGFRYLFYLNNLHVNNVISGSPIYSIVIPSSWASNEISYQSGVIGVIPPKEIKSKDLIEKSCSGQNSNLTDPMFGYSE